MPKHKKRPTSLSAWKKKLDKLTSQLIRERANWTCERCHKNFEHRRGGLDWSHYYGRRHMGRVGRVPLRYHPANGDALCKACHRKFEENPRDYVRWKEKQTDQYHLEKMDWAHNQACKWYPADLEELHAHYEAELKRIRHERARGVQGRMEISPL